VELPPPLPGTPNGRDLTGNEVTRTVPFTASGRVAWCVQRIDLEEQVTASYDGARKWSALCLIGVHSWQLRNGDAQVTYRACRRCNLVDDAPTGPIGF
jgi:hypothetical protein